MDSATDGNSGAEGALAPEPAPATDWEDVISRSVRPVGTEPVRAGALPEAEVPDLTARDRGLSARLERMRSAGPAPAPEEPDAEPAAEPVAEPAVAPRSPAQRLARLLRRTGAVSSAQRGGRTSAPVPEVVAPAEPPSLIAQWHAAAGPTDSDESATDDVADVADEPTSETSERSYVPVTAADLVTEDEPAEPAERAEPAEAEEVEPEQPKPEEAEEAEEPDEVATPAPTTIRGVPFRAKRGNDSLAPIAILAAIGCAAVVGRMALNGTLRDDVGLSVSVTVLAAALLVFALRMSNSSSKVHIDESGLLKVTVGDTSSRFDLTSPSIRIEQTGLPGDRGWQVQILRRSMAPVTIDSRMVDPRTFLEALRQWRPEL